MLTNRNFRGDIMNRFAGLNETEIDLVNKAGYIIEENKEYLKDDYERCATVISDYIMSHSKNDIPKIENEFRDILSKII